MPQDAEFLLAIGIFLLLGLAADALGRRTPLPRVTLILLVGVLLGDEGLGLIPVSMSNRFQLITEMALMMVGFLLGGRLRISSLRDDGREVIWISICDVLGSALLVGMALVLSGVPATLAVLLGCVAAATAPAATLDTVLESGSSGRFARLLTAIVAIDDAWALLLFSLGLLILSVFNGQPEVLPSLLEVGFELGGGVLLGAVLGLPAAFLTGRIRPGQPMLTEALGLVLACGGLALWLNVSYLIATMVMGAVIANLARHHDYPFHEIESIEWPFMVLFFLLAGATLEIDALGAVGVTTVVFVLARTLGKIAGAYAGARLSRAPEAVCRWMGPALLPQAGVNIGIALLAASRFPEYQHTILTVVIGTTVIFELIGPVATRLALSRAGRAELRGSGDGQ